jgi:ABC-2 type transport system ATP-binding protein
MTAAGQAAERSAAQAPALELELRHASRWFGNVVAVNDISFTVGPGITGLLGANGAGKSTVLHLAAGLLRPSSGEVLVAGAAAWRNPDIYRNLALVPEREAIHGFLTAREFVLSSAQLQGVADPEAATDRALADVDLAAVQHRRIETFSKGMRQRAKVAGALVGDPRILLLDEPFNGMDPRQRMHMADLLRDIAAQGRTVLFSSHILQELETMATDVLVLVAGRLAASGVPREIRRLMTQRPHAFRLRTSNDRGIAVALMEEPGVVAVSLENGALMVQAADRSAFAVRVASVARDAGVTLFEVQPMDESLESVFSYLVRS